jgi:hypothetical protein
MIVIGSVLSTTLSPNQLSLSYTVIVNSASSKSDMVSISVFSSSKIRFPLAFLPAGITSVESDRFVVHPLSNDFPISCTIGLV